MIHVGNYVLSIANFNLHDLLSLQLKKHFDTLYGYMKFIS